MNLLFLDRRQATSRITPAAMSIVLAIRPAAIHGDSPCTSFSAAQTRKNVPRATELARK
jgi:hypothetical protein